jgi:hypothetical protein
MDRAELITRLNELLEAANATDDTKPAAAILASLIGAMIEHSDTDLMRIVTAFSSDRIRTIKSRWN